MNSYVFGETNLEVGKKYRVIYQTKTERYPRSAVMIYLGSAAELLLFSARPVAGTQSIIPSWIKMFEEVPDSTRTSINKRYTGLHRAT